jgi:hypothetical protein
MKASIQTLIPKDTPEKIPSNIVAFSCLTAQSKGYKYPPKNSIDVSAQIRTILAYSAKKKKTKTTDSYGDLGGNPSPRGDDCINHCSPCKVTQLPVSMFFLIVSHLTLK